MNFLSRIFKSRPDLQNVFEGMGNDPSSQKLIQPGFSQDSISYSLGANYSLCEPSQLMDLATDPVTGSQQLIYLVQLVSDKIASLREADLEIPWQSIYDLLSNIEHEDSL